MERTYVLEYVLEYVLTREPASRRITVLPRARVFDPQVRVAHSSCDCTCTRVLEAGAANMYTALHLLQL